MTNNSLDYYKQETDTIVQNGNTMLIANKHIFNRTFVPNTYKEMYSYNLLDKIRKSVSSSDFSRDISQLKRKINGEIASIFGKLKSVKDASSSVRNFIELRDRLWELEYKISAYPLLSFVGMLIEKWTAMDLIGFLEKLRYDIVYRGVYGHIQEKTFSAMDAIVFALSKRYGKGFYAEIESFKQEYMEWFDYADSVRDVRNAFATVQRYRSFMDALKNAFLKWRFPLSPDGYRQEIDTIILAKYDPQHE